MTENPSCPSSPTGAHHYMVESVGGGVSVGVCRHCGEEKKFYPPAVDYRGMGSVPNYPCPSCGGALVGHKDPFVGYYRECKRCMYRELS